jgi:hypothetical protein
MSAVPLFLAGLPVVACARIDGRQQPTGACRHLAHGELLGPAAGLAICRDADGGFYLFGCDAEWNTVTDTWHQTLDDALRQAEFEYDGVGETWKWLETRPS